MNRRRGKGTYGEIQKHVKGRHGFTAETCWIAHVRELNGLATRRAWNRRGEKREKPCPPGKRAAIEEALRHFGLI
ncbi:MAG: hypothetical protein Q8R92_17990 [Deltaproteobacteria bacterium]|nr:hypothetical protein [Deltaproteobacteria bacterium]